MQHIGALDPPCQADVDALQPAVSTSTSSASSSPSSSLCASYNLLLTDRWLLAVARRQRDFGDGAVGINGFGFIGLLLGRDPEGAQKVISTGPLSVLEAVCAPIPVPVPAPATAAVN